LEFNSSEFELLVFVVWCFRGEEVVVVVIVVIVVIVVVVVVVVGLSLL